MKKKVFATLLAVSMIASMVPAAVSTGKCEKSGTRNTDFLGKSVIVHQSKKLKNSFAAFEVSTCSL